MRRIRVERDLRGKPTALYASPGPPVCAVAGAPPGLGPLGLDDFYRFLPPPIGDCLVDLNQLARTYAGPELDFDVQVVVAAGQWPRCELGGQGRQMAHLGWNVWLSSGPFAEENGDAVFSGEAAGRT